jgi:endonuclease III
MMNTKEKAAFIGSFLEKLFPHPKISLEYKDPYTLLIAVLLSAQSRDVSVNKVTKQLFQKADTPEKMILLSIEEIEKIIKSCGLGPSKAKAIHELSCILIKKHKGKVPSTFAALEALPGVGHKTASVVMMVSFGKNAFPVDTHIARCAKRWKLSKGKTVEQIEKDLKKQFPKESWKKLHIQIIQYGRTLCPAKGHKLEKCPICKALQE